MRGLKAVGESLRGNAGFDTRPFILHPDCISETG